MKLHSHLLACAAIVWMPSAAFAASRAATTSVQILRAATVTKTSDLVFGNVLPATSSASVTVAHTGARTCSTKLRCYGTPSAGRFQIVGANGQVVSVSLAARSVTLSDGASHSMTATLTTSVSSLTLAGGTADFTVAGVLTVKGNQAEGAYSGQYLVSVDYQ